MTGQTQILGIRHQGPGSARSVVAALKAIQPQVLLVEGLPDAEELLALVAHDEMRPPVALLVYRPDEPKRAVFNPFAVFSTEWQAIRWALANQVPVRFMNLPQQHRLALDAEEKEDNAPDENEARLRRDPFALIAGFSDIEWWWEEQFEKRHSGPEIFKVVLELVKRSSRRRGLRKRRPS